MFFTALTSNARAYSGHDIKPLNTHSWVQRIIKSAIYIFGMLRVEGHLCCHILLPFSTSSVRSCQSYLLNAQPYYLITPLQWQNAASSDASEVPALNLFSNSSRVSPGQASEQRTIWAELQKAAPLNRVIRFALRPSSQSRNATGRWSRWFPVIQQSDTLYVPWICFVYSSSFSCPSL